MSFLDEFVKIAGAATKISSKLPEKPANGILSTEFWLTLATSVWSGMAGVLPSPWDGIVPVVLVGIYTIGRTVLKVFHLFGKASSIPELPALDPKNLPLS